MPPLTIESSVFENSDPIPDGYAYEARNVNPPLRFENVPSGGESLALVVDDPDAEEAAEEAFDHWVLWGIDPDRTVIPEGWEPEPDEAREGENGIGDTGFLGFAPPDEEHTYKFRLYALDTAIGLDAGASKAELEAAMEGHVLGEALLKGTFAPEQVPDAE